MGWKIEIYILYDLKVTFKFLSKIKNILHIRCTPHLKLRDNGERDI